VRPEELKVLESSIKSTFQLKIDSLEDRVKDVIQLIEETKSFLVHRIDTKTKRNFEEQVI
jgi:hypothetical protein